MQNDVRRAQFFIKFSYGSVDVVGEFAYLHEFLSPSHFKLKFENEYIKYSIGDENEIKKKYFRNCVFVTVTVLEFIIQLAVILLRRRLGISDYANYAMTMQTMA